MKTLLLVEDEKLIRQGIRSMIERSGVEVEEIIECNNGCAALEVLKSRNIDVMFTDIRMPKMDGITLVENVQKLDHIPLIAAISGFDDFEYAVGMLKNGVREYILKPVERTKITETLERFSDEINNAEQMEIEQRRIAFRELQYMIFYDNISAGELSNICRNVKPFISFERYVVFCIGNNEEDFSFTERNKYYYFQGNDGLNFIIADEKYKDEVIKKLHKYYIGVSRTYTILYDLKQACCEAVSMRKTAFVKCKPIVEAESFDEPKPMEQYKLKTMLKTTNLICSNNIREALDNIESFAKAIEDGKYSVDEFQEQMNIIIQSVMKIHMSYLKNKESEVREILDMFSFQTIHEYMNMLRTWLNNFDEIISRAEDDDKTGIKMQKAIDYIRENYATDLNMAVVSNHISMNYSLFSFTFKQYTGTNFVNYLKNIRVGQAKKLLTETDMKVNEISKAVGYDHEKHFMKTFKSITGLTPSQYRNNMN